MPYLFYIVNLLKHVTYVRHYRLKCITDKVFQCYAQILPFSPFKSCGVFTGLSTVQRFLGTEYNGIQVVQSPFPRLSYRVTFSIYIWKKVCEQECSY